MNVFVNDIDRKIWFYSMPEQPENHPRIHHRRSIRLQAYDYAQPGAYSITICTHHKKCLFGNVVDGEMLLIEIGNIAACEWSKSAEIRSEIEIGEYVVMPNHMHGIVIINDHIENNAVGAYGYTPLQPNEYKFKSPSKNLGAMIRGFKSSATKRINQIRNLPAVPVFQRNYYEHIIRNESDYERIYQYILTNALRWEDDEYYERKQAI